MDPALEMQISPRKEEQKYRLVVLSSGLEAYGKYLSTQDSFLMEMKVTLFKVLLRPICDCLYSSY
jgi:hypothetical protein